MNQKSLFLDKINGFIISILLLGQYIFNQLAYIKDRESTTETIILIIIILSFALFFYWKDLRSKNFFMMYCFFMLFLINIIIVEITNGEYSEIKIKYFLLYSVVPSFYIIAIVNK